MGVPTTAQTRYRWRNDDGSESGASWKAAINTGWTVGLSDLDVPVRVRIEVANTGTKAEDSGSYLIYMDKNGGGYNQLTTTSTGGAKMVASASVSDGTATTEQLAGSQGFQAGYFDSNGAVTAMALGATTDTEMEYCIQFDSANLNSGDVLSFQLRRDTTVLDGYSNTPSVTIPTLPSSEWTQAEFRIRPNGDNETLNANTSGDWAAAANTNYTMSAQPEAFGFAFGLRFKVSAATAAGSKSLKIQAAKNGGSYSDLAAYDHMHQENLTNSAEIGVFPSENFTDGAATSQVLSGSSFVAGTGEHSGTAAAVSLGIDDHTELEWRIFINKTWENGGSGNSDGDYWDFRLVESDGTVLTTYTNTPRITIDYDNNYVGGCYPESIGRFGIFYATDGDAFTIVEESELTGAPMAMRRASGSTRWIEVDASNAPTAMNDLEAFHVHQVGNTLHIFYDGTDIRYETFDMSAHTWGGLVEQVGTSQGPEQMVFGFRRSDGTTLCFWVDANSDLVYKKRTSGGTWDTSATVFFTGTVTGAAGVMGASDKIYVAWTENETTIYSQSFNSSDTKGTQRTISTDPRTTGSGTQWSVIAPIYWDDSGTEKIGILYQVQTDAKIKWRVITNDGAPGTEAAVTDNAVADNLTGMNSRQAAASAVVDGTTIYLGYISAPTDQDLYYTSSDNGGSWATDIEVADGILGQCVGLGITSGVLSFISDEVNIQSTYGGFTGGIQVREVTLTDTTDELIADNITTTPITGTPSIGQTHALTSSELTTTPVVGTPAIGQVHALSAQDISTTPVTENPVLGEGAAPNPITIESITEGGIGSSATQVTITAPSVVNAGDLLLFVASIDGSGDAVLSENTTSDWTEIDQDFASSSTLSAFYMIADGSEDSESWTFDIVTASETVVWEFFRLSNWHGSQAPEAGTMALGTSAAADPPSLTPSWGAENENLYIAYMTVDNGSVSAGPSGYSNFVELDSSTLGGSGSTSIAAATLSVNGSPEDPGTFTNSNLDWGANTIVVRPSATDVDNLTADNITTTPVVDTPAIGQEHSLDASNILVTPAIDTPTIGQVHVLIAQEITTTPVVDNPSIGESHVLAANDISATPVVDTPAIGQEHALSSQDITTTPVVDTPAIGQEHALSSQDITTTPVVGNPVLGEGHNLIANDISTTPVVDTPEIGVIHNLVANDIVSGPVIDTPGIGQEHVLNASDISTTPTVGNPVLTEGVIHNLIANDITATPVVDTTAIGQEHALSATEITANPEVGNPILGTQGVDNLIAQDILVTPVINTPALGQTHILSATGISATPIIETPTIFIVHNLIATDITTTPTLETPVIGQIHALLTSGIDVNPVVGTPILGVIHVLTANSIEVIPIVNTSTIGQIHVLSSGDILVLPTTGTPVFGQVHVLLPNGIITIPELGHPSLDIDLIEYPVAILASAVYPMVEAEAIIPSIDAEAVLPILLATSSMED